MSEKMKRSKTDLSPAVSIVMPTHTGTDNISNCLESIAKQKLSEMKVELRVIIDGPNQQLEQLLKSYVNAFKQANIDFHVNMLDKNVGRFKAILTGAESSKGKWLVLTGDRILWPKDYLYKMSRQGNDVAIPYTLEDGWEESIINLTLHHIRNRIYKLDSKHVKPFYITRENFEKSGKGSGGIWIDRQLFIWACRQIEDGTDQQHTSDDTKLLKVLVDNGHSVYWTNETHIVYRPRSGFLRQINHIYQRGPRFVDYYLRPGTRYYLPLLFIMVLTLTIVILVFTSPVLLLLLAAVFIGCLMLSVFYLCQKISDIPKLLLALPVMGTAFYMGLIRGIIIHYIHGKKIKIS
jgi:glycosyltransferase involved in cell wall biosynthesis